MKLGKVNSALFFISVLSVACLLGWLIVNHLNTNADTSPLQFSSASDSWVTEEDAPPLRSGVSDLDEYILTVGSYKVIVERYTSDHSFEISCNFEVGEVKEWLKQLEGVREVYENDRYTLIVYVGAAFDTEDIIFGSIPNAFIEYLSERMSTA